MCRWLLDAIFSFDQGSRNLIFCITFFIYILIAKPYLEGGQYNTSAIYETILRAFPLIMLPYLQDYQ